MRVKTNSGLNLQDDAKTTKQPGIGIHAMNLVDIVSGAIISHFGRVFTFFFFVTGGSILGIICPTALPYREHHPFWDILSTLPPCFFLGLFVPGAMIYYCETLKWRRTGIILTVVFSFFGAWGLKYGFTK